MSAGIILVCALVLLFLFWMAVVASGAGEKNKKIRFMAALPLSVRKFGIYRVVIGMAHLALMLLLFSLSSLISQRGHLGFDYLWWMLTKAGSILVFGGFGGLSAELYWCVRDKKWGQPLMRGIVGPLILGIMIASLFLYLFTIPGPAFYRGWLLPGLSEFFLTFKGAFGLFLFSLALIALNVYVYEQRRSYTDQIWSR